MKFLVVGLGSMGKRRIRCLKALGHADNTIAGFDLREDRRNTAASEYGVGVYGSFEQAMQEHQPDALVISVPPHVHHIYMKDAIAQKKHFFVEASVLDNDFADLIASAGAAGVVAAPSTTMIFHPAIGIIRNLIQSGKLGKLSNMTLHSGQFLPDWHTYESVSDFYVSRKDTGGAREITPFELTWVVSLFGLPARVCGCYKKTIDIAGAEQIDDTYSFNLDYGEFVISGLIDVVSRSATRRVVLNGSERQLVWDWGEQCVRLYHPETKEWEQIPYNMAAAAAGYDSKIGENMYIDELGAFVAAAKGGASFPNTLEEDWSVLKLLYAIEQSSDEGRFVAVQPAGVHAVTSA